MLGLVRFLYAYAFRTGSGTVWFSPIFSPSGVWVRIQPWQKVFLPRPKSSPHHRIQPSLKKVARPKKYSAPPHTKKQHAPKSRPEIRKVRLFCRDDKKVARRTYRFGFRSNTAGTEGVAKVPTQRSCCSCQSIHCPAPSSIAELRVEEFGPHPLTLHQYRHLESLTEKCACPEACMARTWYRGVLGTCVPALEPMA